MVNAWICFWWMTFVDTCKADKPQHRNRAIARSRCCDHRNAPELPQITFSFAACRTPPAAARLLWKFTTKLENTQLLIYFIFYDKRLSFVHRTAATPKINFNTNRPWIAENCSESLLYLCFSANRTFLVAHICIHDSNSSESVTDSTVKTRWMYN